MPLIVFLLIPLSILAQTTLYPFKSCALYDNLKHTKNTHDLQLDLSRPYTMIRHHKGQYLLKIEGDNPSQRWVDDDCLTLKPLRSSPLYGEKKQTRTLQTNKNDILAISWHNAFCETHRKKKECLRGVAALFGKKHGDNELVLHGLWPQPKNRVYCGVAKHYVIADKHGRWQALPEPALKKETKEALKEVMPGVSSNLHRHEWIKHGTCYGSDAQTYFGDAVALIRELKVSPVESFFRKNTGKRIGIERVREIFDRAFGKGSGNRVQLRCKKGMITELWLHLGGERGESLSSRLRAGKVASKGCGRGIVDKAGFR